MISPCSEIDNPDDTDILTQKDKKSTCVVVFGGAGQTDLETDESERMEDSRFETDVERQLVHTGDDKLEKAADTALQNTFDKENGNLAGPGPAPLSPQTPAPADDAPPAK